MHVENCELPAITHQLRKSNQVIVGRDSKTSDIARSGKEGTRLSSRKDAEHAYVSIMFRRDNETFGAEEADLSDVVTLAGELKIVM